MSIADKLTTIAENQEKVYEAGQKSMVDESKIIEKTVSGIHQVILNDVSEIPHTITCRIEAVELFDKNKYKVNPSGLESIGFDISNLVIGQEYIFRSNLSTVKGKISNYTSGYNSVSISGTEFTFTMARNENISETATQYLFLKLESDSDFITDIAQIKDYEFSIVMTDTNIADVVVNVNDEEEYKTNEEGIIEGIESISPSMSISTASSWQISVDYHKSYGSQLEYDRFWDAFQDNGNRLNYQYGFGYFWTDVNFKPKYPIIFGRGYTGSHCFWNTSVSNLAESLEKQGVYMDTTQLGHWNNMFQLCKTSRIPTLNCTYAMEYNANYGLYHTFNGCTVEKIDKMIVPEELKYLSTFINCTNLKDITFEGVIGESISFQWSPLSVDSMKSIISCLKDFSGTTDAGTRTLTFTDDCWAALEADSSSPSGGTWEDYVTSLGWTT